MGYVRGQDLRIGLSLGGEQRLGFTPEIGFDAAVKEVEDVSVLCRQRGLHAEHALDKAVTGFGLRAERAFSPKHSMS